MPETIKIKHLIKFLSRIKDLEQEVWFYNKHNHSIEPLTDVEMILADSKIIKNEHTGQWSFKTPIYRNSNLISISSEKRALIIK